MKNSILKIFFSSVFLIATLSLHAWTLEVQGLVKKDGEKLAGATATLYSSSEKISRQITSKNGKFRFDLQPDKSYMVTVTKSGHVTKRISFYTRNVPEERGKMGFAPFRFEVTLFRDLNDEEINKILTKPLARIHFVAEADDFGYDEIYTKSIKEKIALVNKEEKRAKFEHLKKEETVSQNTLVDETEKNEERVSPEPEEITPSVTLTQSPAKVKKESYKEGNRNIVKHTVNRDGREIVYSKVTWGWGATYYFKDGNSITENEYKEATEF